MASDGQSEEIQKLSEAIQAEKDSARLLVLVQELTRLLDEQRALKEPKPGGRAESSAA
jgi:hypothetical protein